MFSVAFQLFHSSICGFKSYFICQLGILKKAGKSEEPSSVFFIDIIFRILGIFLKSECKFNACSCCLIAADYSLPGAFVDGGVQNMPFAPCQK